MTQPGFPTNTPSLLESDFSSLTPRAIAVINALIAAGDFVPTFSPDGLTEIRNLDGDLLMFIDGSGDPYFRLLPGSAEMGSFDGLVSLALDTLLGTFNFITTGAAPLASKIQAPNGVIQIGDPETLGNGTVLEIDDDAGTVAITASGGLMLNGAVAPIAILAQGSSNTSPLAVNQFGGFNSMATTATESVRQVMIPFPCKMKNFYGSWIDTGGSVATIRKNGANTALVLTGNSGGVNAQYSDTANEVDFAAGDLVSIGCTVASMAAGSPALFSVGLYPV